MKITVVGERIAFALKFELAIHSLPSKRQLRRARQYQRQQEQMVAMYQQSQNGNGKELSCEDSR
jgi:hypothetical protein